MARRPGEDNGVSGLPEEWGRIVIPDDPSQLADLEEEVRAELAHEEKLARRERRLPFIVLAATVIITLVSLFTVPWVAQLGESNPTPSPAISRNADTSRPPASSRGPSCDGSQKCDSSVQGSS